MFNLSFWKMSLERALKTAAQAVLLAVGASSGLDLFSLDWLGVLGTAAAGALLSVVTSMASVGFGDAGTPSLVHEDVPGSEVNDGFPS